MKLLVSIPAYFPAVQFGGYVESLHSLLKCLNKKIDIKVLTTDYGLEGKVEVDKWTLVDEINVKYFKYLPPKNFIISFSLLKDFISLIKESDVIYFSGVWNFQVLLGSILCLIFKRKYIVGITGVLYAETLNIKSKFLKYIYLFLLKDLIFNKLCTIRFTTEDEKRNIAPWLKLKSDSVVIPNAFSMQEVNHPPKKGLFKEKFNISKDKKIILFLGRINKKKGLDLLVESFSLLSKDHEDLILAIVGPDSDGYKNDICKMIKNYNLEKKVLFTGLLEGVDKITAFIDSEMFVLSSYSENFGVSVVEAMSCGAPVVISNKVGIYKDVEEYDAGIVTDLNTENIYNGMKTYLIDEETKSLHIKNAYKLIKDKYNNETTANSILSLMEKICSKNTK